MDPNSDVRLMQNRSMGGMGGKSRGRVNRGAAAHYRGQRNIRQRQLQHSAVAAQQKNVGADIGESSLDGMMIGHVLKAVVKDTTDDGDWIDKLHHRYTSILFVVLAILVSTKQYVGEPINCWCPAHFSRAWVEYTNNICWISNTYYTPFEKEVKFAKSRAHGEIKYYQWIPLLLSFQGFLFYVPRIVWKALSLSAGIDVSKLVNYLTTFESVLDPDRWEKTLSYTAVHLDRFCNTQRDLNTGFRSHIRRYLTKVFFPVCSRRYGNVLIVHYILCKLLYLLNVVVQLFALDLWLGTKYHQYGIEVAVNIIKKLPWSNGHRFPQVTLCDFSTRDIGEETHDYTVQCVMTINIFNEKIYLLVWFWLVFVGIATVFNFFEWIFRIVFFFDRANYIKKHLKLADRYSTEEDKKLCRKFIENYLKPDGVFVIRLISKNTNSILVSELIAHLWDTFRVKMLSSHTGNTHVSVSGEVRRAWTMQSAFTAQTSNSSRHCDSPTDHRGEHSSGGEENSPTHSKTAGNSESRTRQNSIFDSASFFNSGASKRRRSSVNPGTKYNTIAGHGHTSTSTSTGGGKHLLLPGSTTGGSEDHHSQSPQSPGSDISESAFSTGQNLRSQTSKGSGSETNKRGEDCISLLVPPPMSISLKDQSFAGVDKSLQAKKGAPVPASSTSTGKKSVNAPKSSKFLSTSKNGKAK